MRNQLKKDPLGQAIKKCLTVGGVSMAVLLSAGTAVADECDVIYGVHDDKLNDSQFVTIDPVTYEVLPLGPLHEGKDFEGLDINSDGSQLIASSGDDVADDDVNNVGVLSKISTDTGEIEETLGQICFSVEGQQVCGTEISALSFHPAGGLSAWSEECGLINVDMANPVNSTLVFAYATDGFEACLSGDIKAWQKHTSYVEDFTWDNTGNKLYAANGGNIEAYEVSVVGGNTVVTLANTYSVGGNIEAVEMLPDNETLLLKVHGSHSIKALDLNTGTVNTVNSDVGIYTDIEAAAACIKPDDGVDGSSGDDDGNPDDGTSDDGTPDDGTPDDGTPDDGTPDDGTPDDGTPDDGTPDDGTPDDGTPDDGTPDDGTPDDGTPDDGTPDDGNTPSGPTSTTITLDDGSSYEVSLDSRVDNTWTYRVKEVSGKDLSHWVLGVGNCAKLLSDGTPANTEFGGLGPDGSTGGFYGVKWNTGDKFSDALFSFTLDADYPSATIDVLAKAGSKNSGAGHKLGQILGPDCGVPGGFSGSSDSDDSGSTDSDDSGSGTGGKGNGKGNGKP